MCQIERESSLFLWNENLKPYKPWIKEKPRKKLQNNMTLAVLLLVRGKKVKIEKCSVRASQENLQ